MRTVIGPAFSVAASTISMPGGGTAGSSATGVSSGAGRGRRWKALVVSPAEGTRSAGFTVTISGIATATRRGASVSAGSGRKSGPAVRPNVTERGERADPQRRLPLYGRIAGEGGCVPPDGVLPGTVRDESPLHDHLLDAREGREP